MSYQHEYSTFYLVWKREILSRAQLKMNAEDKSQESQRLSKLLADNNHDKLLHYMKQEIKVEEYKCLLKQDIFQRTHLFCVNRFQLDKLHWISILEHITLKEYSSSRSGNSMKPYTINNRKKLRP